MANISGHQPGISYCPVCKEPLRNIPREEMTSIGYQRADGTVSEFTHTPREPTISAFEPINRLLKTDRYNGTTYNRPLALIL